MMRHLIGVVWLCCVVSSTITGRAAPQERWSKQWEERLELTQPSEKIMDAIGIRAGMVVAEVGAGNGRFAVRMAARVGSSGRVYANEIDPRALDFMRKRVLDEKLTNMVVVEGQATDPQLPPGSVDVVVFANTLHMVEQRLALLRNILPALRHGGVLAVLDVDPEKMGVAPDDMGNMPAKNTVLALLEQAGFTLVKEHTFLPRHYFVVLQAGGTGTRGAGEETNGSQRTDACRRMRARCAVPAWPAGRWRSSPTMIGSSRTSMIGTCGPRQRT